LANTDYYIIVGYVIHVLLVVFWAAILEYIHKKSSWRGITISLPYITLVWAFASIWRLITKNKSMSAFHIVTLIISVILHYGYPILYWGMHQAYTCFYIFLAYYMILPLIFFILTISLCMHRKKKVDKITIILVILGYAHAIGLIIFLWIAKS